MARKRLLDCAPSPPDPAMRFGVSAVLIGFCLSAYGQTDDVIVKEEHLRRSYRLEDFFWTGSGDGEDNGLPDNSYNGFLQPSPRPLPPWRTTTVYKTTTIVPTASPGASSVPPWQTTTIYKTTTILSTAVPPTSPGFGVKPTPTVHWPESSGIPTTSWGSGDWSVDGDVNDLDDPPEPRFWLLTVVQSNATLWPYTPEGLEARLARLYRKAFLRQQERHLGLVPGATAMGPSPFGLSRSLRSPHSSDSLKVTIHNVTTPTSENSEAKILYWVRVRGRPVPATTAARDMRLVSDAEVSAELGLPVLTKAEPFLKPPVPMAARSRARDTWILVAAAAGAAAVIVTLLVLLGLALTQRQRQRRRRRRQQLQQRDIGADNAAFQGDDVDSRDGRSLKGNQSVGVGPTFVTAAPRRRRRSRSHSSDSRLSAEISSSCSMTGSNESAGEAPLVCPRGHPPDKDPGVSAPPPSQLVSLQKQRKRRRRVKEGRTVDTVNTALVGNVEPDHQEGRVTSASPREDDLPKVVPRNRAQRGAVSPTSYLSMPSVKSFPRAAPQPEPLTRVLGPSSNPLVDDDVVVPRDSEERVGGGATGLHGVRHSSLEGDPGVLGPVVWGLRCQRMRTAGSAGSTGDASFSDGGGAVAHSASPTPPQLSSPVGAAPGRMRRRFHELLDDALSLFGGSRSTSQEEEDDSYGVRHPPDSDPRVQSAVVRHVGPHQVDGPPRPRTTGARRPATAHDGVSVRSSPRGAWSTAETSPTSVAGAAGMRPLSAGPFHRPSLPVNSSQQLVAEPVVDSALVLVDARLPPSDPAVPLIAAIKKELSRFGGGSGGGGGGGGGRGGGCGPRMLSPPLPGSAAAGD